MTIPASSDQNQNLFSLNAQISYINKHLEKEKDSKIKDVFKNTAELKIIKDGISEKLQDLSEHSPNDEIKKEARVLQVTWEKIKSRLDEENEISTLLQSATSDLKTQMDKLYAKTINAEITLAAEGEYSDKITQAVRPHFEPATNIQVIEEKYPKTTRLLFDLAVKVSEGGYGENLREAVRLSYDEVSSHQAILSLLLIDLCRTIPEKEFKKKLPEVFLRLSETSNFDELIASLSKLTPEEVEKLILNPPADLTPKLLWCRKELDRYFTVMRAKNADFKALKQIFEHDVNKISNPSHLTVKLFLGMGEDEKAMELVKTIRHPIEQSKSLADLVTNMLKTSKYSKAEELASRILTKPEKKIAETKIADKYLQENKIEEAISYANSLTDLEEKKIILEQICIGLATKGQLKKALSIVETLEFDEKNYTLSRMVKLLASKGQFKEAKETALLIEDKGYREDANGYILKPLISLRRINEAIEFTSTIKNPNEKTQAVKLIEKAALTVYEDEKIKNLIRLK